jgi:hypothetical protein
MNLPVAFLVIALAGLPALAATPGSPQLPSGIKPITFGFTIDPVIATSGFQACTGLTGYIQEPKKGDEMANTPYSINECASGSVTIKQKSPLNDMQGKQLDLIVTNYHVIPENWQWGANTHIYRGTFPTTDTIVFSKVSFGSGLIDNPAQFNNKKDQAWINEHFNTQVQLVSAAFHQKRPVKFEVFFNGRSYTVLHCAIITATNGTPAVSCPDSVNAPTSAPLQPVVTPSPVYKPR